jgi:pyruvate/2-oxoglutarate dehydrogenase complex dihydrolipoamide dehydrogenase (E3) component
MSCFSGSTSSGIFYCATNPVIGHERDTLNETPPRVKKKVLVAGGGVGGMQAALTASERGHEVILCEKTDRLGGTLLCEEHIPFKSKLDLYLKRQALRLSRSSVDIRMNTEVTPELAREIAPDVIIAALGARPAKPPVPGIDGGNVFGAEEIYFDPAKAGQSVAILGAGLVGLELGIFLAQSGRTVNIIEMLPTTIMDVAEMKTSDMINHPELLAPGVNIVHGVALAQQVKRLDNLNVYVSARVTEITEGGVKVALEGGEREFAADTVVYAVGQKPLADEALALSQCAPEYYPIGDCVEPANIMAATGLAYQVARDIGDKY